MNAEQTEQAHEDAQRVMADLLNPLNLYPPISASGVNRPIATARDLEMIRTAQLAVIAAAIRWDRVRSLPTGRVEKERERIRAMDTEMYREYLLGA
jgi:hypothetical protein